MPAKPAKTLIISFNNNIPVMSDLFGTRVNVLMCRETCLLIYASNVLRQ